MKKVYNVYDIDHLLRTAPQSLTQLGSGKWVPARPIRYSSFRNRVRMLWLVLTDQVDLVRWEGQ